MTFEDEIRGFLSEHLSGLLNESTHETRSSLKQALDELTRSLQSLEELVEGLQVPNVDSLVDNWSRAIAEMVPPPPPPPPSTVPVLYQALTSILLANSQGDLLQRLMNGLENYADGIAVFVTRGDHIFGWLAHGLDRFQTDQENFRSFKIELQSDHVFARSIKDQDTYFSNEPPTGNDGDLIESFAGHRPRAFCVIPIIIRGKVAGLVYLERHEESWDTDDLDQIQILVWFAALCLETMPTRLTWINSRRTLGASLRREISSRTEMPTQDLEQVEQETVAEESLSPADVSETGTPEEEMSVTPSEEQLSESHQTEAIEIEEETDEELASLPEEERQKHEDARRFSRLLVSEIKLYNEQQVLLGRMAGDIYQRLKEDIIRSWQVFLERVDQSVLEKRNYFYEDLVRILADGDPNKLGIDHWPPEDLNT